MRTVRLMIAYCNIGVGKAGAMSMKEDDIEIVSSSRKFTDEDLPVAVAPSRLVRMEGHTQDVADVLPFDNGKQIATVCHDRKVRLFKNSTDKTAIAVLNWDTKLFLPLGSDLFATFSADSHVVMWRIARPNPLSTLSLETHPTAAMPLDHVNIVMGTAFGDLIYFSHRRSGSRLRLDEIKVGMHTGAVRAFAIGTDIFVSVSDDKTAAVWDVASKERLATLAHHGAVTSVAVNERYIVTGCANDEMRIFNNGIDYTCLYHLNSLHGNVAISSVLLFGSDLVMTTDIDAFLLFFRISTQRVVALVETDADSISNSALMADGRIAICGQKCSAGYCATISPPTFVAMAVQQHARDLYAHTKLKTAPRQQHSPRQTNRSVCSPSAAEPSSPASAVDTSTPAATPGASADASVMKYWAEKGVSMEIVRGLDAPELASMLASFILAYRPRLCSKLDALRACLLSFFDDNLISGEALVGDVTVPSHEFYDGVVAAMESDAAVGAKMGHKAAVQRFIAKVAPGQ